MKKMAKIKLNYLLIIICLSVVKKVRAIYLFSILQKIIRIISSEAMLKISSPFYLKFYKNCVLF
jgi:hypothetical protein